MIQKAIWYPITEKNAFQMELGKKVQKKHIIKEILRDSQRRIQINKILLQSKYILQNARTVINRRLKTKEIAKYNFSIEVLNQVTFPHQYQLEILLKTKKIEELTK